MLLTGCVYTGVLQVGKKAVAVSLRDLFRSAQAREVTKAEESEGEKEKRGECSHAPTQQVDPSPQEMKVASAYLIDTPHPPVNNI